MSREVNKSLYKWLLKGWLKRNYTEVRSPQDFTLSTTRRFNPGTPRQAHGCISLGATYTVVPFQLPIRPAAVQNRRRAPHFKRDSFV